MAEHKRPTLYPKIEVKMAKATKETIKEEIDRAITADEQANANYYGAIRGFTLAMLTTAGTNMDAASLKEIEAAWVTKESSGKNLRRAYMKLFGFQS